MARELASPLVDDRPVRRLEPPALEEAPVVVPAQEARLLALRPLGRLEARHARIRPRFCLRPVAEREPDPRQVARVEAGEHVRLILVRIGATGEQQTAPVVDDARVVPGGETPRSDPPREREQLREAEAPVAADARVRRFAARVRGDERLDDREPELLAQVERDVRKPERVARVTRRKDRGRRAAGPLGVRPVRIDPEA